MAGGYRRNSGPKPKAPVLKLLQGNPGKRAHQQARAEDPSEDAAMPGAPSRRGEEGMAAGGAGALCGWAC